MSSFNLEATKNSSGLSEIETQRYDRQIRVWGAEAQSRIQNSKVLICGFRGINAEVVKNIVLAGVCIVIQDSGIVQFSDLASNFFLTTEDVGKKITEASLSRIQALNSFAKVEVEVNSIDNLNDEYFKSFSVILCSEACSEKQAIRINNICRSVTTSSIVFFWSQVFGEDGCFFADFGNIFNYKEDPPNNKIIKTINFPSLEGTYLCISNIYLFLISIYRCIKSSC